MTVVYVDSVFALNTAVDYLVLLLTARLAGVPLRRGRYLLAALLGGSYAVAVFYPGMLVLAQLPVKLVVGGAMALMAFGGEERLLRLTLLMLAVACGLAGCVLGLGLLAQTRIPVSRGIFYTDIDLRVLILSAAAAYGALALVFRASARRGVQGDLVPVRVCIQGKTAELTALLDSGNGLRDEGSGRPVLVVAPGELERILSEPLRRLLTPEGLRHPAELLQPVLAATPGLAPRLLPYRAVGISGGLLLALRTDWVELGGERLTGTYAALSPTALGVGYGALWGGTVRKDGRHGRILQTAEMAAGAAGTGSERGHPLHRGQRYSAAAPVPGAGGRAGEPHRRGGGPPGADRA